MKLQPKIFAQMRAASRVLMGKGPIAATAALQEMLQHNAATAAAAHSQAEGFGTTPPASPAAPPPMRDINPPPQAKAGPAPAPDMPETPAAPEMKGAPMFDHTKMFDNFMPDMLANLDRMNEAGRGAFAMPNFQMPAHMAGMHAGASAADALPGKFIDGNFSNAAGTRHYKLYVPSSYTGQAVPLVVMLHGCTQDPDDFARGTQMNALAEEMHCLVLYPAQSQQANSSRCWNWFSAVDQTRDKGEPSIIAGMTREVMGQYAIDPGQVYVAGLSAGGAMATIMGTLYPELYAAVGVHSGLPYGSAHDLPSALAAMKGNIGRSNQTGRTIPIIVFHGDRDTTVHPANGDELIARGAPQDSADIVVEPGRVPQGHAYTRTMHQRADGSPHAEQWLIHGAGHAWSGGNARGTYTDGKGPDASREMMRFFRTQSDRTEPVT
ncbi:MAG TPA: PHB depolymerase family esterase [Telluria sp.]